jgi:hypothetical protein
MIDISPAQIHGLLGGTDDPARRQAVSDRIRQKEADENFHSDYGRNWEQDYSAAIEVSINCTLPGSIDPPTELIR